MKTNYRIFFPLIIILVTLNHCREKDDPCNLYVVLETGTTVSGGNVLLKAKAGDGLEPYTYKWTGGTRIISDSYPARTAKPYDIVSVEVIDNLGCVATESYKNDMCTKSNIEAIISQSTDAQLNVKLEVAVTGGFDPYKITWSTGEQGYSIIVPQQGNYSLTVTDYYGCTKSVSFNVACKTGCLGCNGDTTVTDNEGNVYNIVTISNRCWMAENLRTSAGISEVTDGSQWGNLTNPAWCYYGNNSSNDAVYGKLYNWYAVNTGNLCPGGWHIPTHDEWQNLIESLGGEGAAGGAMKDTTGWTLPNTGATNSSGFAALPGGIRNLSGNFVSMGMSGVFWSSTENSSDQTQAWAREFVYNNSNVSISNSIKARGFSCRCVKD